MKRERESAPPSRWNELKTAACTAGGFIIAPSSEYLNSRCPHVNWVNFWQDEKPAERSLPPSRKMKSAFQRGSFKAKEKPSLCTDASQRVSFSQCVCCDAGCNQPNASDHPAAPAQSEWHKENKESAWFLHIWNLYFLLCGMRKSGIDFHSRFFHLLLITICWV